MSNHFTYEIDERNLRTQLKAYTVPVNENAWQKIESFSDSKRTNQLENKFVNFNITLNRNVILPSVFGVIIIIFSLLLVNFVSIENPVKEKKRKAEAANSNILPEETNQTIEKTATLPVISEPKVEFEQPTKTNNLVQTTPIKPDSQASIALKVEHTKEQKTITLLEESKIEKIPETSSITSTEMGSDTAAISLAEQEAKAKRKAKRRSEAIETQKLLEIRPSPVSEENDVEVRPN
jgi:hypothetical protein